MVPQFYLRAFTNAGGKLHRFRKDFGTCRELGPKQVGFVENFHRYPVTGGTLEPILDRQVENPLSQHHRSMLAALRISRGLPYEEREWLDRMLVHQLARLPHQRERIERIVDDMVKIPKFAHRQGVDRAEMARQQHLRIIASLDTKVIREVALAVGGMQVSFLQTRWDQPFWTADIPVMIGQSHARGTKLRTSVGLPLGHPRAQVYFPLSKDIVAVFHHGTLRLPPLGVAAAEPEHVVWLNMRLLGNAARDVYSPLPITVPERDRKLLNSKAGRIELT